MSPTVPTLETKSLAKSFQRGKNSVQPLVDINLSLQQGECVGLMGPNGTGKSTLLRILSTLVLPDSGSVNIHGQALSRKIQVRRHIGLLTANERNFYWRLTGRENLVFFGSLMGIAKPQLNQRIQELAEQLECNDYLNRRFDTYSSGMKQNLSLARVLLHNPNIVLLDEPTRSLDVEATRRFSQQLQKLKDSGQHSILMATHNALLAWELCDRVLTMDHGVISQDRKKIEGIAAPISHRITTHQLSEMEINRLEAIHEVVSVENDAAHSQTNITVKAEHGALQVVLGRCLNAGIQVIACTEATTL